jgi:hypothetical protein
MGVKLGHILREERRLMMFWNMVIRIFGPKRDQSIGELRKLHNEELNDPYSSPNIVRVIKIGNNEMGGACSTCGGLRGVCRVLIGKREGKRLLGRQAWIGG